MRERLTELVKQAHSEYLFNKGDVGVYEFIADRLIDAGVILPPVRTGQTVWYITRDAAEDALKAREKQ